MVVREKVTIAVLILLIATGGWYGMVIAERGLAAPTGWEMLTATVAFVVLTAAIAGLLAASGAKARQVDERDGRVTLRAQALRGFLYLALSFGVLGVAIGDGNYALANTMFLAILGIEILSGFALLVLYRISA